MEYLQHKEAMRFTGLSKSTIKRILKDKLKEYNLDVFASAEEIAEKTDLIKKEKRSDKISLWLYSKEFLEPHKKISKKDYEKEKQKVLRQQLKKELLDKLKKEKELSEPIEHLEKEVDEPDEPERIEEVDETEEPFEEPEKVEDEEFVHIGQKRLKGDTKVDQLFEVLLGQIQKKDDQITSLLERVRESNLNLNNAVRKLTAPTEEEKKD